MAKIRAGRLLIAAGVLMIALAAALLYANWNEDAQGGRLAEEDYWELVALIPNAGEEGEEEPDEGTVLSGILETSDDTDDEENEDIRTENGQKPETSSAPESTVIPEPSAAETEAPGSGEAAGGTTEGGQTVPGTESGFPFDPDAEMPTENVKGNRYIGVLKLPKRGLSLPVMSDWSYPGLKIAPCRYTGSVYSRDMVICGHNYSRHFGPLKDMKKGETVTFTDVNGNLFRYSVISTEVLKPNEVDRMVSGEWDLTLFTCTYGGKTRVTVCCRLEEYRPAGS